MMIPDHQVAETKRWIRSQMYVLRIGGMLAIPRSGLIFEKRGPRQLVLVARMPYDAAMEGIITPEDLKGQQQWDFEVLRDVGGSINYAITDESTA